NISANLALKTYDKDNIKTNEPTLQGGGSPENKITSANYANSRSQGYSASKTLATIGQGNLIISDTTNSDDTDRLNRNTDEINKDLYNTQISSNIQASIDTRLFTEQGRKDIKDDINKATAITNALSTIIQTGNLNFNQEVGENYNTYQTNKAFGENLINILENDNLSIAEKESFLAKFTQDLAKSNGYDLGNLQIQFINDTNTLGADNQAFKGNYNANTNTITLNLANISNLNDLTNTLGHEFTHAITDSKNKFTPQDTKQNDYADLKGGLFADYLNKALNLQGNNINLLNSQVGIDFSNPNNINTLVNNQRYFNSVDKSGSDNVPVIVPILFLVGGASYLNAPKDENDIKTGIPESSLLLMPVGGGLAVNYGSKLLVKETLGQTAKISATSGILAGGIETGSQITTQLYNQAINNYGYVDFRDITLDYSDIAISTIGGATLAPGFFQSMQKGSKSFKAQKNIEKQLENAKTQNRKDKLNLRIDEHKNNWQNHLKYQGGFFILDNGIKAGANEIEKTKNE
ncbi:MAG: hypothetical protein II923_01750, partial [Campylobacter sp.]|nr:hypothetical protein [Campylobacter sp.]